MKMRDCMLWVVKDSKKKSSTIDELRQEVNNLRASVEKKDADFTRYVAHPVMYPYQSIILFGYHTI